jgi:ABC-type amino acid transport substrate-binding protein
MHCCEAEKRPPKKGKTELVDSGFGTWMLNKEQQELVNVVDGIMEKLFEDGTMVAIAIKYYGENVYQYIDDFKYASVQPKADYK